MTPRTIPNTAWTKSPLVINGPMAGVAGPHLAAAVSNAGGLGFIGAGIDMKKGAEALVQAQKLLTVQDQTGSSYLPIGYGVLCFGANLEDALKVIADHRPIAVWLFAAHEEEDYTTWTSSIRERTCSPPPQVWIQTSSIESVLRLAREVKPDVLVIQGSDAGGHGTSPGASIISLLPEAADALKQSNLNIPLVAAGGIADGRGAAAALALGASGVCIGTRFIASEEAQPTYPIYKDIIVNTRDGGYSTVRSMVFDEMHAKGNIWPKGYDGRGLRNATTKDQGDGVGIEQLRKLSLEACARQDGGFQTEIDTLRANVWAGTGVGLVHSVEKAGDIVITVREDAKKILREAAGRF